jgi:hypothetical protein
MCSGEREVKEVDRIAINKGASKKPQLRRMAA